MTDTLTVTAREWLEVGKAFHAEQERLDAGHRRRTARQFQDAVEAEIAGLTWRAPRDGVLEGPMSPLLMLEAVITQTGLRPAVGYTYGGCLYYPDGPETATYSLLGIEIQTRSQHFRVYLLDTGLAAVPMRLDDLA